MAEASSGNRGKALEAAVRQLFKRYAEMGIHCHQNHPRALQDGRIVEKSPYDFELLYSGVLYAFDTKMCESSTWNLNTNAKVHQVKALHDVTMQGGHGFFLVLFTLPKPPKLVKFPVPLPEGKASLAPEDGVVLAGLDFLGVFKRTK